MDKGIGISATGMERRRATSMLATPPQFTRIRELAAASPAPNKTGKKHPGKAILAGEVQSEPTIDLSQYQDL